MQIVLSDWCSAVAVAVADTVRSAPVSFRITAVSLVLQPLFVIRNCDSCLITHLLTTLTTIQYVAICFWCFLSRRPSCRVLWSVLYAVMWRKALLIAESEFVPPERTKTKTIIFDQKRISVCLYLPRSLESHWESRCYINVSKYSKYSPGWLHGSYCCEVSSRGRQTWLTWNILYFNTLSTRDFSEYYPHRHWHSVAAQIPVKIERTKQHSWYWTYVSMGLRQTWNYVVSGILFAPRTLQRCQYVMSSPCDRL